MLNPSAAAYDAADDDIDPATGLPRQQPAAPTPTVAPEVPTAPAPAAPVAPAPDDVLPPGAGETAKPGDAAPAAPAAPARTPLPDLSPSKAEAPPDIAPPSGARQKFQRTLESPEDKAISADQDKLTGAALTAEQNASQVRQAAISDEQAFRAQQTQDALDHQKRVQDVLAQHDAELQAALAKKQEYFDAARGSQFHDLYAERSTGDRVLGALAVFLGGLGGGDNKALTILNAQMQHAYDKQAADIDQKWKLYGEQSKNVEAAQRGKAEAISDLNLLQSARYETAADQLEQMKIRQGIPAEQARSDQAVVAIRQKALDIRAQEAKDTRDRVEWDTYGKVRGGGGGGTGRATAAEELARRIRIGADDGNGGRRELSLDEKIHAANELKIPLNGKPSDTTLDSVNKGIAFDAKQAAAMTRAGQAGERQLSKEASQWQKSNGVDAIGKKQRELETLQKELTDNANNPLAQALALEKAVSAARGGAASKQALSLALGHLGGSLDSAEGVIQKIKDGQLSQKQLSNFRAFINGQLGAAQAEGLQSYNNFNKYVGSVPQAQRDGLLAERSRIFSGLHGFGGQPSGDTAPATQAPANKRGPSEAMKRLAQEAINDPHASPQAKARAVQILGIGGAGL